MEQYMQQELTEDIIKKAAQLYDVSVEKISKIGGFENFVFEYEKNNEHYILRFVHSGHRTYELVLAEIEFIDYLDQNNACVSTVVHSIHNQISEKIDINNDHYFTVTVFIKAKGDLVKEENKTAEFYQMFGREVGKLHRLTKSFKPKHKRPQWYEENFHEMALKHLPKDDEVLKIYDQLETTIKSLPTHTDNYGLIHTDLHFWNMFYDPKTNQLTFFDFDDSAYKHFLSDIAIIVYYHFLRSDNRHPEYNQKVHFILKNLFIGYEKENHFDRDFLQYLNVFLLLRSVILYIVLVAAGYETHEKQEARDYVKHMRETALQNRMFADLDIVLEGI